ncbi:phosphonate ABC transporter, inner membrane subunit [Desulfovibrio sp. X2]|uniref:phosphonate ABC transporter, permease protein PhnE n=1 Tax=Desulfovibrio sp. X2 TaxID=941449 RepID=UPI000358D693|nr:phosphonate ABC transporter, permease protein PhnE [Desulfovibrio sp. X2]EPR43826.1 phosphonate ABC transporter, inner membrane subunit [Desulfovibrio sp. X2]
MHAELTLQSVTPRTPLRRRVVLGLLAAIAAAILVTSYVSTGINPFQLYNKRENAFHYLFGRQLSEMDMAEARRQAERMPEIMLQSQAMQELRKENAASTQKMGGYELQKKAEALAEKRLKQMPAAERQQLVDSEYERQVDERRGGYFPPDMHKENLVMYGEALLETVAIAIWGTLFAFIAAVPVSVFAARNTLGLLVSGEDRVSAAIRWFCQFGVRRFLDFCRGFNEFVMALIFVAVIGLGPFAGVMSLAIHTFGILGKVFSEGIEAIEPGQVEAVEASGAGPAQIISFSVLPQIMPLIVSYTLLRFESNVRSATILGFVGAGGIGFLIFDKINGYLYREVSTMMIMVILCVTLIDYGCGILRKRFT